MCFLHQSMISPAPPCPPTLCCILWRMLRQDRGLRTGIPLLSYLYMYLRTRTVRCRPKACFILFLQHTRERNLRYHTGCTTAVQLVTKHVHTAVDAACNKQDSPVAYMCMMLPPHCAECFCKQAYSRWHDHPQEVKFFAETKHPPAHAGKLIKWWK